MEFERNLMANNGEGKEFISLSLISTSISKSLFFSDYALKKVVVKNLNVEVTVPDILASKANLNL